MVSVIGSVPSGGTNSTDPSEPRHFIVETSVYDASKAAPVQFSVSCFLEDTKRWEKVKTPQSGAFLSVTAKLAGRTTDTNHLALRNTIHTTISGVYGSWYFNSRNYPTKVTRGALKRALTYSFGSISLGSLVVAIINFLRQLCSIAQQNASSDGNILGTILFCILGCLISIIEWAVEFLNRYAFSHIALYGKAYIPAAKDTWTMIKNRGIDALINECLIGPVLIMGATFVAYASALLAYLYIVFTAPAYNSGGGFTGVVVAFSFLIGLQICNVFTTPLSSGIDTIFVAMAWDPEVMMRDHGDLYHQMVVVYPHVAEAIHA
ncbi:plasma-membrane choline transporter-domain-containing protein [Rhypophila decipiens]|uniref:Protein PNS1 n=1 Tax=Rhypophila decipiens TaxID=261697 RepID=A0AAN6XU47_9PEZI|nr:plasma-membrane choline transporter-domain-containing protein [Rhypophila decipiens]